jgi:hypothetical protein
MGEPPVASDQILSETITVEYQETRDGKWVFAKSTENLAEAQAKANSLWENPSVQRVRLVRTTRTVIREKSRSFGQSTSPNA